MMLIETSTLTRELGALATRPNMQKLHSKQQSSTDSVGLPPTLEWGPLPSDSATAWTKRTNYNGSAWLAVNNNQAALLVAKPYQRERLIVISPTGIDTTQQLDDVSLNGWLQFVNDHIPNAQLRWAQIGWSDRASHGALRSLHRRMDEMLYKWIVRYSKLWPRLTVSAIADAREHARHTLKNHAYNKTTLMVEHLANLVKLNKLFDQDRDQALSIITKLVTDVMDSYNMPYNETVTAAYQGNIAVSRKLINLTANELRLHSPTGWQNIRRYDDDDGY